MRLLFVCLFLLLLNAVNGQSLKLYPPLQTTFYTNMAAVNPAYIPVEGKGRFVAAHQSRTGPFRQISSQWFTGSLKSSQDQHAGIFRVIVANHQQGPYISEPRGYINYAYQIKMKDDMHLSAGLMAGVAGIFYSAQSATGSGSATVPDGAVAMAWDWKGFLAGASLMQMFNSELSPITESNKLQRHIQLLIRQNKKIAPYWDVSAAATGRQDLQDWRVAINTTYHNALTFGAIMNIRQGLAFSGTLHTSVGDKDEMTASFTYQSSFLGSVPVNVSSLEVILGYVFR